MGKTPFVGFVFLLLRGTAESGALKANALPGGARRLAVRAVKGAQFAFIGAKRETLDRRSGRSRRRFSAGRANWESSLRRVIKSGGISHSGPESMVFVCLKRESQLGGTT